MIERPRRLGMLAAIAVGATLGCAAAGAQSPAAPAAEAPASKKWIADCGNYKGWIGSQCSGLRDAWYDGKPVVIVSGYTWHDPATYDDDKLEEFNAKAWGGGFGWGRRDAKGDHYSWYALAFKDSHDDWTKAVGWTWVTSGPEKSDYAVGLGYTAFIMSRPDIANNIPFPAALPLASVKLGPAELLGTFIPKLNGGVNHGNVAYFFGRIQF